MAGTLIGLDESGIEDNLGLAAPAAPAAPAPENLEDASNADPAPAAPAPEVVQGDDVPEKYRGKTATELLSIVRDQESHIGKQGQELGDLRTRNGTLEGLVDKSLALRSPDQGRPAPIEDETSLSDDDFLTDPRDATARTVRQETAGDRDRLARLEASETARQFGVAHPTAGADINDPAFIEFVSKSQVRVGLAQKAFGQGTEVHQIDFNSANELWSLYEDYNSFKPATTEETVTLAAVEEPNTDAAPAAAPAAEDNAPAAPDLVTGNSSDAGGKSNANKPIYSQAKLNRMMLDKPDLYWAADTQAKLDAAYAEGRVTQDV